jgi:uncharacterized protein YbjT (DUF2867 family)
MTIQYSSKKALIFGASGLVGSQVTSRLMDHTAYEEVHAFYRTGQALSINKLYKQVVDFEKMQDWAHLIRGNDLFICLGTTMKQAGSKAAFYHQEFDYISSIAQYAEQQEVGQLLIISALGADAKSVFFYNQVKGLIEDRLKKMNFWAIHFFRPSLLLGERVIPRTLESYAAGAGLALKAIAPGFFKNSTPIESSKVAGFMVSKAQDTRSGVFWHSSADMAAYKSKA